MSNAFPFFRGIAIKGQHFLPDAGKAAVKLLVPGDTLTLEAEPVNPHDCYAVAAFHEGERVGYVQKEVSAAIAWLLAIKMPLRVTIVEIGKATNLIVNVLENKP